MEVACTSFILIVFELLISPSLHISDPEPYFVTGLVILVVYSFSCILLIYGALKLRYSFLNSPRPHSPLVGSVAPQQHFSHDSDRAS